MKKRILKVVFIATALALLAACGKEKKEATKAPTPTESATLTPTEVLSETPTEVPTDTPSVTTAVIELTPLPAVTGITVPENSSQVSYELARQLLVLCSGDGADDTKALFEAAGFTVVLQQNYNKTAADTDHTSGYTVGTKMTEVNGEPRLVILTSICGTNAGEWYSNFDFAPSHSNDTHYAENFLYAATNAYLGLSGVISSVKETGEEPLMLVCGYSRGAAVANLLGVLLDKMYSEDRIYTYTFATPTTVRGEEADKEYGNIFNFINPCDVVPLLPLTGWGYRRAGTDITLYGNHDRVMKLQSSVDALLTLAPTISSYYTDKHSLTAAGLSDTGITTYDMMTLIATAFTGLSAVQNETGTGTGISFNTDITDQLNVVSADSDFNILMEKINSLISGIDDTDGSVLMQHIYTRYYELLGDFK